MSYNSKNQTKNIGSDTYTYSGPDQRDRVTVNTTTKTYFGKVFGVSSFNVGAQATAVHRPRDIAIVLDFSGSMHYSSETAYPPGYASLSGSLNPDSVIDTWRPAACAASNAFSTAFLASGASHR